MKCQNMEIYTVSVTATQEATKYPVFAEDDLDDTEKAKWFPPPVTGHEKYIIGSNKNHGGYRKQANEASKTRVVDIDVLQAVLHSSKKFLKQGSYPSEISITGNPDENNKVRENAVLLVDKCTTKSSAEKGVLKEVSNETVENFGREVQEPAPHTKFLVAFRKAIDYS